MQEIYWIPNKRKTNASIQHDSSLSPPQSSSTSSTPFSETTLTSTPEADNKNTISKPQHDLLKDFDFQNHKSEINKNTDIEKIFKIFEKISHY
jgi:hypothetical protein